MGLHTGGATVADNGYLGVSVHRAQRICSAAHGGQILLSNATREIVEDDLPRGVDVRDLGEHELKDLDRPARLFQAVVDGLASNFPPPRTGAPDPSAGPSMQGRAVPKQLPLIVGAVALLAGIAIAYAVFRHGSGGPTIPRVDPNSVGIIDPDRNALVSQVPVGNEPTQIAVGGDSVWVANAGDRTAMQIDPETGNVERTRDTGADGAALTAAQEAMWEGGSRGLRFSVTRVDAEYGTRTGPRPFATQPAVTRGFSFNFGIAVTNGVLWLAQGDNFVEADPRTLRVRSRPDDVARFAIDMVSGGGSLWILNGSGAATERGLGDVTEYNPRSRIVAAPFTVGQDAVAIAYGAGSVWVGLASGAVVRIDPKTQAVSSTDPSAEGLVDLAAGEGSVWVARRVSPTVDRIDPERLEVTDTIDIGTTPASIAVGFGKVWVTAY
jgi:streptogramin lyase